jgi:chromosome segregation ATPase
MAKQEIVEAIVKSNIGELSQDLDKVKKSTEELDKETKETGKSFKDLGTVIRSVGTAIKVAGIAVLASLFAKLVDVFRQNQKVVDTFNTAMEFLSMTFNDFLKFLDKNIDTASGFMDKIFGNEVVQNVLNFGRALSVEIITRIKNIIQGLGGLAKGVTLVFKGKFPEALQASNDAMKNFSDAVVGNSEETAKMDEQITKVTNKIKEYTKSTFDNAKAQVQLRKDSELAAAKVQGLIEEYDRQAEKLRQVRDDETKTFEERIAANEKLGDVLKEQEKEMLKLIDIQIQAAQVDLDKNNNLENQIRLQELLNERKGVEAQITGFQSEQLTNQVSLLKEKEEADKAAADMVFENTQLQLSAYSQLSGALSALAGDNKALAVAGAIIDTYAGATKALKVGAGTPIGFIQAAAVIASGLANVRKILQTDVGSGGSGGSVPSASASTPAPQMLSGAFDLGGVQAPEPVQAFVVTDDMTNSQDKLATIRRRATI